MEIRLVVPVLYSESLAEKARSEYQACASAGVDLSLVCVANGTNSIESEYDLALAQPEVMRLVQEAEGEGADACAITCFGDPGAAGAKELVSIPVVRAGKPDGYNVWDSYMGMMATTPGGDVTPDSPPATDRETARMFGRRVAAATLRWKCGDPS